MSNMGRDISGAGPPFSLSTIACDQGLWQVNREQVTVKRVRIRKIFLFVCFDLKLFIITLLKNGFFLFFFYVILSNVTITQTVDIPASRRVYFDLPPELPIGNAKVELRVIPFVNKQENPANDGKIRLTKQLIDEIMQDEVLISISGILKTDMTADEIREERLAKYLL